MAKRANILKGIIATALVTSACDNREPVMSAEDIAELEKFAPGMTDECLDKARYGGLAAISGLTGADCYEMEDPRVWRGLWRNEFEGSQFCPEPQTQCFYESAVDRIYLSYSRELDAKVEFGDGKLYEIEFVGSRTAIKGYYGHMGMFDHMVDVEEIRELRPVSEPR